MGLPRKDQPVGAFYYDLEGKIHTPGKENLPDGEILPEMFARVTLNYGTYANKEGRVEILPQRLKIHLNSCILDKHFMTSSAFYLKLVYIFTGWQFKTQ